jgi:ferric-dicitrate binding protein FerR (iron transport regulator)
MKVIYLNLLFLILISLFSCSNSKLEVTTNDNYETVNFPDGSFAYLNRNSSIEFDKNFTNRIVKQKGEVFYEVKRGNNPFIVETESGEIKVLGTKFNVKSSKDEIEVEVESGSVELKIDTLVKNVKKGQKAIFKDVEKNIKIAKSELKHKQWICSLEKEFKKLGKEITKDSKKFKKESEKIGKEVKKEFNKLKKKTNN